METLRIIEHGNGHTDIEALIYGEWVVVKCILEDTMPKTDKFSLYEERGELLDCKVIADMNERPFYLQSQLGEMYEQIRLIENITADNQRVYFSSGSAFETLPAMVDPRTDEQIALDIFQSETEATRESDRP